jgi:hypothetical protein
MGRRWSMIVVVVFAGIAGFTGAVQVAAEEPSAATAEANSPATHFEVVLLSLKTDWQAMRYHTSTGESWYAFQGNWKPVPEASDEKPPAGAYKVLMSATGERDWIALRLEQKSGRSWRLAALKWIEMQPLDPGDLPPVPQGPPDPHLEAE